VRFPAGLSRWTVGLAACLAASALLAREAHAEASVPIVVPLITPYVNRGILYGPLQGGLSFGLGANTAPVAGSYADGSLDVALGITSYITLDGSLGTISLSGGRSGGPRAGLWLGLVDTPPLEVDAAAHVTFGVGDESAFHQFEPGGVAVFRFADEVRVDVGAYFPVSPDEKGGPGLRLPVSVAVQLNPYLHATLSSGVTLPRLGEAEVIVPFGIAVGATLPLGAGGYAVVSPSVSWPSFAQAMPGPTVLGASLSIVTPP
jgi:hypothetical protein